MQVICIFSFFLYSSKKKKLIFNLSIYIMPLWHLTCNYGMFINSFLAPFFGVVPVMNLEIQKSYNFPQMI